MAQNKIAKKLVSIDQAVTTNTMDRSELLETELDLASLECEIVELLTGIRALRSHVDLLLHGNGQAFLA